MLLRMVPEGDLRSKNDLMSWQWWIISRMPSTAAPDANCHLYIRQFPVELKQQAKARAALENKTLFEWITKAVRAELARKPN